MKEVNLPGEQRGLMSWGGGWEKRVKRWEHRCSVHNIRLYEKLKTCTFESLPPQKKKEATILLELYLKSPCHVKTNI